METLRSGCLNMTLTCSASCWKLTAMFLGPTPSPIGPLSLSSSVTFSSAASTYLGASDVFSQMRQTRVWASFSNVQCSQIQRFG